MKRISVIIAIASLLAVLAGCQKQEAAKPAEQPATAPTTTPTTTAPVAAPAK